ncbi:hypothetical protein [Thioclava sp.]|uniref:hypothetical protein n=1 Tax=Thioclava sp. TaxID=1933450 RepID=UPI003AA98528
MVVHAQARRQGGHGLRNAVLAIVSFLALVALFWMTWKSQFAAPASYVFKTPTQEVEAAYCLAVVRQIAPGGSFGGYLDEAQDFWLKRLMTYGGDMADNLTQGETLLGRHLATFPGPDRVWLMDAMDACSNRALVYGFRFRAFQ